MSEFDGIKVHGAREHNLKNISVQIPRDKITVITGISGSGKSTLAFDTIYAEGQRRYVDSLSTYARNFMDQLKKPEVDSISGLSPAIAIDQKTSGINPRSTVGTVTETYDYLRLLFAKVGIPHCPQHGTPVSGQSFENIIKDAKKFVGNEMSFILAPFAQSKKGEFHKEFAKWLKKGFVRAKIDGVFVELEKIGKLAKTKAHDIDIVIDRLTLNANSETRFRESINSALIHGNGMVVLERANGARKTFSTISACNVCGFTFPELEPRFFSYNHPKGACPDCNGIGTKDIEEVEESVYGGVDAHNSMLQVRYNVSSKALKKDEDDNSDEIDERALNICKSCNGTRLRADALFVLIDKVNITELSKLSAGELFEKISTLPSLKSDHLIAEKILDQLKLRLRYLVRVGAGYLTLDRMTRTLSGGEAQRIRLASQLCSSLIGITYILDEPSIGLHPRDHHKLLEILRDLKDQGNTIIVVEHDYDTIISADQIIDIGPRAGKLGGEIMAMGTLQEIKKNENSLTAKYLNKSKLKISQPKSKDHKYWLELKGAQANNLKNIDLKIPLSTLTTITGVSGSGKSTLIIDTLYKALANHFYNSGWIPGEHKKINGIELLDKVIEINQKPIGRTPRSTPATYVGLLPLIRDLYANLPESKMRGYQPGRFSFNVKGGRCENCQGGGAVRVEMHFMSDVFVECESCLGKRYNPETLFVKYRDKSISDILEMTVSEAVEFFVNHKMIHKKLITLLQVGLEYMTLGQSSTTLSGGEAQRVKLSRELSKRDTGKTLYILDEPTTGLHFADVENLIKLLHNLVEHGNTVVVIEHNSDIINSSDYVIDLGPEGGPGGGHIVATGTPDEIRKNSKSITGKYL